jgi:hypothetical protein
MQERSERLVAQLLALGLPSGRVEVMSAKQGAAAGIVAVKVRDQDRALAGVAVSDAAWQAVVMDGHGHTVEAIVLLPTHILQVLAQEAYDAGRTFRGDDGALFAMVRARDLLPPVIPGL